MQPNTVGNTDFNLKPSDIQRVKAGEALIIRVLRLSQAPPHGAWQAQDLANAIGPRLKSRS
jgi:hypothetical protein